MPPIMFVWLPYVGALRGKVTHRYAICVYERARYTITLLYLPLMVCKDVLLNLHIIPAKNQYVAHLTSHMT